VRQAVLVTIAWAALLSALTAMLWIWSPGDELAIVLLGGAALGAAPVGFALAPRARREAAGSWVLPDLSPGTALLVIALATILLGLEAGQWLMWFGAGLLAFALFGLGRELRLARRRRG
jgi:hypothetical protein